METTVGYFDPERWVLEIQGYGVNRWVLKPKTFQPK
jgi:hypothetical protein